MSFKSLSEYNIRTIASNLPVKDIISVEQSSKFLNFCVKDIFNNAKMVERNMNIPDHILPKSWDDFDNASVKVLWTYANLQTLYEFISLNPNKYYVLLSFCKLHNYSSFAYDLEWCLTRYHHERLLNKTKQLTHEQEKVCSNVVSKGDIIGIQAFAGTGKTTTLVELARRNNHHKILYLAFNKALSEEASTKCFKDMKHVTVSTMHALAFDKKFNVGKMNIKYVKEYCDVDWEDASNITKIIDRFQSSNCPTIELEHIQAINCCFPKVYEDFLQEKCNYLWSSIINGNSQMTHDSYLKMYQLKKTHLDFDIIMLDEAQDCTPAMFSIIMKQKHAARIFVGDKHQQLYNFRGVMNPFNELEKNKKYKQFNLTYSFRYGYEIAHISNIFLNKFKNEQTKICSGKESTKINNLMQENEKYTIITRSNLGTITEAFKLGDKKIYMLFSGKLPNCEKEVNICIDFMNIELHNFNAVKHRKLKEYIQERLALYQKECEKTVLVVPVERYIGLDNLFKYFSQVRNFKWTTRIKAYKLFQISSWTELNNKLVKNQEDADVIITNTHNSKGLEYDNVKLGNDFISLMRSDQINILNSPSAQEDYNIIYVAMTRAKKNLILNFDILSFLSAIKGKSYKVSKGITEACHKCGRTSQISLYTNHSYTDCIGFDSTGFEIGEVLCDCCFNIPRDIIDVL